MKLVLLTALSPDGEVQHRYVARYLIEEFGSELKAIIVGDLPARSVWEQARRHWNRYSLSQIFSRALLKLRHKLRNRHISRQEAYRSILFPHGEDGKMPGADMVHLVSSHNGKGCLRILEDIQPDIIAVYGTVVLGNSVISAAGLGIINMHTGVSPRYRGSDTIFWPLHENEPENVGVTIHQLNPDIDAGPIFAVSRPSISPDDNEDTLFAKCVREGCPLFVKAIREQAQGTAVLLEQDHTKGREYRSVERTVSAERKVERNLREGLLRHI